MQSKDDPPFPFPPFSPCMKDSLAFFQEGTTNPPWRKSAHAKFFRPSDVSFLRNCLAQEFADVIQIYP